MSCFSCSPALRSNWTANWHFENQVCVSTDEHRQSVIFVYELLAVAHMSNYLVFMFITNRDKDIQSSVNFTGSTFARLQSCPWSMREISLRAKGKLCQAVGRSILLYGCETWPVRVTEKKILVLFDKGSSSKKGLVYLAALRDFLRLSQPGILLPALFHLWWKRAGGQL